MRVAIISSCSLPIPAVKGGAVESLIENFVRQNEIRNKIEFHIYSIYDHQAKIESSNYPHSKFFYLKKPHFIKIIDQIITVFFRIIMRKEDVASKNYIWKLIVLSKIKRKLKNNEYDAIILQNTIFLFNAFNNKYLLNKYKDKVYFHVHNSLNKSLNVKYKSLIHCVISISDFLHKNIKKHLGNDIKIVTVHNGIECNLFNRSLSDENRMLLRKKYGIEENNKIIVFVGRIAPEKGIKETVLAFNLLNRNDCDLLIVGASYFGSGSLSPYENEIINLIKNNHKIHVTGFVEKKDVWKYYALGDLVVLPSIWEEPLGLTMIEAQAAGIPLITTISGGIPETVNAKYSILLEKDSNIVTNIKKSMDEIINNLCYWKNKAAQAKIEVNIKYDESIFYRKIVNIIDRSDK